MDAPVSGGTPRATDGTLAIMVGGAAGDSRGQARLAAMGTNVIHVGGGWAVEKSSSLQQT